MDELLNKKIVVDDTVTPTPKPNKKLLKKLKSRKVGWMSKEEFAARKVYLNELNERERYND